MNLNVLGPRWDAATLPAGNGYARVRDGLRAFDSLADQVRSRQDALTRASAGSSAAWGGGAAGSSASAEAAATLGGALAAYLSSDAGRSTLDGLARAAVGLAGKFFSNGPEQLPLPLG